MPQILETAEDFALAWSLAPKCSHTRREIFHRYTLSRPFLLLRQAVMVRAGGVCERCTRHQADHIHHTSYTNRFHEPLEDLLALCAGCHAFIHARSHRDPKATAPARLALPAMPQNRWELSPSH